LTIGEHGGIRSVPRFIFVEPKGCRVVLPSFHYVLGMSDTILA